MATTKVDVNLIDASGITSSKYLKGDGTWGTVDALPSQTSQSGKFLTTDGSDASWGAVASSGFVAVTFYTDTSGDTWSKSTNNPTKIIVEVISGAGGSGAGASGSGGSGGAGSYGMAFIDVSTVDTATITVGAGGAAGSSGAGGTGGTSKFTYATGTGSFTEMECPGGNGGGHANHTGGSTTSLPTGPTNGVYIAGNGGGGASNSGGVSHGYGASQMGGYTYNAATGYGSASSGSASTTAGRAGNQGMVVVWEYK